MKHNQKEVKLALYCDHLYSLLANVEIDIDEFTIERNLKIALEGPNFIACLNRLLPDSDLKKILRFVHIDEKTLKSIVVPIDVHFKENLELDMSRGTPFEADAHRNNVSYVEETIRNKDFLKNWLGTGQP